MDDRAFLPGTPEVELEEHKGVLVRGGLKSKLGRALLTNDRVLFFDQKFNAGAAGAVGGLLAAVVADRLEKRHKKGGPLLDVPLGEITRVTRATKFKNKELIVLSTPDGEHRFNEGYSAWAPLLRRALVERHGRTVVEEGDDAWRIEA
jgi:hypothetical protein